MRSINLPVHFDFMIASSYGNGTETSGTVKILKDLDYHVAGKHLIIIEDIIDSGTTMASIMRRSTAICRTSVCSSLRSMHKGQLLLEQKL